VPLAVQIIPCVFLATGVMFFPESPRHLMETDREEQALAVLRKLHFNGSNEDYIMREFHEIKTTIAAEKAISVPGWRIMFKVPQWRTRLMHGVAVQAFTQFTGISTLNDSDCWVELTISRCHWLLSDHYV
jgi:DNA integrity scanning protein DisA with diadenylate cyclase activity